MCLFWPSWCSPALFPRLNRDGVCYLGNYFQSFSFCSHSACVSPRTDWVPCSAAATSLTWMQSGHWSPQSTASDSHLFSPLWSPPSPLFVSCTDAPSSWRSCSHTLLFGLVFSEILVQHISLSFRLFCVHNNSKALTSLLNNEEAVFIKKK